MPVLRMNRRLTLVTAGAVTALTVLGATLAAAATATPPPPVLSSVSATALAQAGIQLQTPTSSALISQAAAQQTALQAFPGSTLREIALADFSDTNHAPALNALAWAVSLTPPPGSGPPSVGPPPGHKGMRLAYLVVFIDASTGTFIEATSGGQL
jgi:hypothetical protein